MSAALSAFDYIASIIPGTVFLYGILWLCPDWRLPFLQTQNPDLGSLSIFLIIALIAGQLLEAVGRYALERPMIKLGLVRQSTKIMCSKENQEGLGHKLGKNMDEICKSQDRARLSAAFGEVISKEAKSTGHNRVELFENRYYMHLDLATAFLLLAIISVIYTPHSCAITAFLVFVLVLSLERAHHYDGLYASELFRSFLMTD